MRIGFCKVRINPVDEGLLPDITKNEKPPWQEAFTSHETIAYHWKV